MRHRALFVAAFAAAAFDASGAVLYDNGGIVTHPGGGFGGADASVLQSSLGLNTYGFSCHVPANNWVADDFTVGAGEVWTIESMDFLGYQTGSGVEPTINDLRVVIFDAEPVGPPFGTPSFGNTSTSVFGSASFSGIYRSIEGNVTANNRPVMRVRSRTLGWVLGPGTYWVAWQMGGTLGVGPFQPPVTLLGLPNKPGSNARHFTMPGWNPAFDTGLAAAPQDMPFVIHGSAVPEPATIVALACGFTLLAMRRKR